jgi:hypothetical protein
LARLHGVSIQLFCAKKANRPPKSGENYNINKVKWQKMKNLCFVFVENSYLCAV